MLSHELMLTMPLGRHALTLLPPSSPTSSNWPVSTGQPVPPTGLSDQTPPGLLALLPGKPMALGLAAPSAVLCCFVSGEEETQRPSLAYSFCVPGPRSRAHCWID